MILNEVKEIITADQVKIQRTADDEINRITGEEARLVAESLTLLVSVASRQCKHM